MPEYRYDHIHLRSPDPNATACFFGRSCHGDGGHEWGDRRRSATGMLSEVGKRARASASTAVSSPMRRNSSGMSGASTLDTFAVEAAA